ncbi:MAG: KOW domain-containing RNA-binding protein [Eubacteriales bacterium]|nr:KOW domain-containing RNA-binding protein [Eubacteriales bacterium]
MDERIEKGMLAVSKAGHDQGNCYVIVDADDRFVWLADGKLKLVSCPKKKNRKHIQVIRKVRAELPKSAADEEVKRILKWYSGAHTEDGPEGIQGKSGGLECQKQM